MHGFATSRSDPGRDARDQEDAGLDIVTDGQMWYDDYVGVIGSFCWYMYERIPGFEQAKEIHPSEIGAATRTKDLELLADWGDDLLLLVDEAHEFKNAEVISSARSATLANSSGSAARRDSTPAPPSAA